MGEHDQLIGSSGPHISLARKQPAAAVQLRIGAVQERWHPDPDGARGGARRGIRAAAGAGARLVCLQELTLSPLLRRRPRRARRRAGSSPRICPAGPTLRVRRADAPREPASTCTPRCTSAPTAEDGLGYNTAIIVAPDGALVARTRKLHIPVTAGYHEDRYFRPGPAGG